MTDMKPKKAKQAKTPKQVAETIQKPIVDHPKLAKLGLTREMIARYVVSVAAPLPPTFNATRVTGGKESNGK